MTHQDQALQVTQIHSNGYFEEPLGEVRILDHYHSFLFFINTTKLEDNYLTLIRNLKILETTTNIKDNITNKIKDQLKFNLKDIKGIIDKLHRRRIKRGLINILGSAIKFITGNPDNDDLLTINENLEKLQNSQKAYIEKINRITSFANHVSNRFAKETQVINSNLDNTVRYLQEVKNQTDYRNLLQTEIYQTQNLLRTLLVIERTVTLSLSGMSNLELISMQEFKEIQEYLNKTYGEKQLLPSTNEQTFELLIASKLIIIGTNHGITFLLKIPIIKPFPMTYFRIYPVPNEQGIVVAPPKKYTIRNNNSELWTNEDCLTTVAVTICLQEPSHETCSLKNNETTCTYVQAQNNYKFAIVLKNQQILAITSENAEIIEDCSGLFYRRDIKGAFLLSSSCRIIFDHLTFASSQPVFQIQVPNTTSLLPLPNQEINLKVQHLEEPEEIFKDAEILERSILTPPALKAINFTSSIWNLLILIIVLIIIVRYRKTVYEVLCKKIIKPRKEDIPETNEAVLHS